MLQPQPGDKLMSALNLPVEMISLCNDRGELKPLRFRYQDRRQQPHVVHVDEVLESKELNFVGVQVYQYLCRARLASGKEILFELRYTIKNHYWVLFRVID
ncbi:MAG: hypothetical protein GX572_03475 [Clostridia bacterium]|nr:hypothetical protein [Clostridia bacterium]